MSRSTFRPIPLAVGGMNCQRPAAPTQLTARGLYQLSTMGRKARLARETLSPYVFLHHGLIAAHSGECGSKESCLPPLERLDPFLDLRVHFCLLGPWGVQDRVDVSGFRNGRGRNGPRPGVGQRYPDRGTVRRRRRAVGGRLQRNLVRWETGPAGEGVPTKRPHPARSTQRASRESFTPTTEGSWRAQRYGSRQATLFKLFLSSWDHLP